MQSCGSATICLDTEDGSTESLDSLVAMSQFVLFSSLFGLSVSSLVATTVSSVGIAVLSRRRVHCALKLISCTLRTTFVQTYLWSFHDIAGMQDYDKCNTCTLPIFSLFAISAHSISFGISLCRVCATPVQVVQDLCKQVCLLCAYIHNDCADLHASNFTFQFPLFFTMSSVQYQQQIPQAVAI